MTNQTIDGVPRHMFEAAILCMEAADHIPAEWAKELRSLLEYGDIEVFPSNYSQVYSSGLHIIGVTVDGGRTQSQHDPAVRCSFCDATVKEGNPWSGDIKSVDGKLVHRVMGCKDHKHLVDALRGVAPVPAAEYKLRMGDALKVFEALKADRISRKVEQEDLGPMGATEIETWSTAIGVNLEMHTAMGGCTLIVRTAPVAVE